MCFIHFISLQVLHYFRAKIHLCMYLAEYSCERQNVLHESVHKVHILCRVQYLHFSDFEIITCILVVPINWMP
jgi:hypothetical protein